VSPAKGGEGPYFVLHFRDGSGMMVESFTGAGSYGAALRTYQERQAGWSECWMVGPLLPPTPTREERLAHSFTTTWEDIDARGCAYCGCMTDGDQLVVEGECPVLLRREVKRLELALAGRVDPIFASSLRENLRAQLVEQLGKKVAELEHALSVEQDAGGTLNAILTELDRRAAWLTEECRKGGTCYEERDQAVYHRDKVRGMVGEWAKKSREAQDPAVPVCEAHGRPDPTGICAWVEAEKRRMGVVQ